MAQDLWRIRRQKQMTIDQLARKAGIHPSLIKAYELGQRPIPSEDIEKLAVALEVEPWEIKELSDPPPRGPSRYSQASRFETDQAPDTFQRDPVPLFDDTGSPPRYGSDPRPRYEGDPRPRYEGDPRPRYEGDLRPRYESDPWPRYESDPRPRYESDPRPRYERSPRSRYQDDRPRSGYGSDNRSRYGDRPRYGDHRSSYDDRGSYRPRRPERSGYGDREERQRKRGRGRRRQPAGPARQTQVEHLKTLMVKLDMTGDDLLRLAGKPLSMLNRKEAAKLLGYCQKLVADQKPPRPKGKRQRPYLPESVDEHELVYLTEIQLSKREMELTLFNGDKMQGMLMGFSPYALTLSQPNGQEVTVQKLAVAYYQVDAAQPEQAVEEEATA